MPRYNVLAKLQLFNRSIEIHLHAEQHQFNDPDLVKTIV